MKLFSSFAFASAASGTIFRTRDQIQDSFVQIPDKYFIYIFKRDY